MRKLFIFVGIMAMALCFAPITSAGPPGPPPTSVEVEGSASSGVAYSHGDLVTGGYYEGGSGAAYDAADPHYAAGEANSTTSGIGGSIQTPNFASSGNLVGTNADASAIGMFSSAEASGGVDQGNWAGVSSPNTIAVGGDSSYASFDDADYGGPGPCGPPGPSVSEADGCAVTGGSTVASQYNDCITSGASADTCNFAMADGGFTDVGGSGGAMTGAQRYGTNGGAIAQSTGDFEYNGRNFGAGGASSDSNATQISYGGYSFSSANTSSSANAIAN